MQNIYEAQTTNKRKSLMIVLLFLSFVFVAIYFLGQGMAVNLGYQPGGLSTVGLALIISGLISFGSYYYSDKIVLTISGAKKADRRRDFNFYTVAENLSLACGLPKPSLYVINDSAPNAFATGRNPQKAIVCVTSGLLDKLSRSELEGVIAHELSHIKNYDMLLMSLVAVMVGSLALLGDWFLRVRWLASRHNDSDNREGQFAVIFMLVGLIFALLSPLIARLIQLAISRRREFMADAGSVLITKQPSGLISALEKIATDKEILEAANKATAHLYIINPFKKRGMGVIGRFAGLFNTHPPTAERIKTLRQME